MTILYYTDQVYGWHNQGTLKSLYEEVLSRGYNVILMDRKEAGKVLEHIEIHNPDQIWLVSTILKVTPKSLNVIKSRNIKLVGFGFSEPQMISTDKIGYCDTYFTNSDLIFRKYKDKKDIHYNPIACDFRFHKIMNIEKKYDITYIGTRIHNKQKEKLVRARAIDKLRDSGIDVHCFGKGWERGHPHNHGRIWGDEFLEVINQSHLGLDIYDGYTSLAHRILEYSASAVPIITGYREEVNNILKINKEVFCYQDIDDLIDLIKFLFENRDTLKMVGMYAYSRCQESNDIKHRVDAIEKALNLI